MESQLQSETEQTIATLEENLAAVDAEIGALFRPAKKMLVSQWAEANRILPKGTTARPGPYEAHSFQRGIMDAICDDDVEKVSCLKSTQVGWTEIMLNIIGWKIDTKPGPMMYVLPRDSDAKDKSKKTIQPMIDACKSLASKVFKNLSRKGGNTQLLKQFFGGFLKIAGANAGNMRSDPVELQLFDEVDGYDQVNKEGSFFDIAERRLDTFERCQVVIGSTPALPAKLSPAAKSYEASDQSMFYVPCPYCGEEQPLLWLDPDTKQSNFSWELDKNGKPIKESVQFHCRNCKVGIKEHQKQAILRGGRWIPKYPERTTHRGFYINAIYSPWKDLWHNLVAEWIDAQGVPDKLRAFWNLRLGLPFEEAIDTIEPDGLLARREQYDPDGKGIQVPMGVAFIVCTVDVQKNRIEAKVTGFGPATSTGNAGMTGNDVEEWHIAHEIFWGAPGLKPEDAENEDVVNVWEDLDAFRLRSWKHASGAELRPVVTFVDSGAYSDAVAAYVMPRQDNRNRVYACKGVDFLSRPGLVDESIGKKHKMRLFRVGTHAAKERIMSRLQVNRPGANYMHFPMDCTEEFFKQLTSECKVRIYDKRTRKSRFVWALNYERNEVLDMEVYAHAARVALQTIIDPTTYGDLLALHAKVCEGGAVPASIVPVASRRVVRSSAVQV
ncbi:phage terminase large subunit family protein [Terriglobus albidus]|uniref:phage terminase large subunit family protein n=1 Tax=Terriglobus albidus TaxID=1592106 RepID=UPI0021E036D6|nr:phage terminase large subunit family protein [Terriglobus albidus]